VISHCCRWCSLFMAMAKRSIQGGSTVAKTGVFNKLEE
jgi:hypothetical protein